MKIAIASGKGGTGKTFVSTNLFKAFKDLGYSTILVDADVECPNSLLFYKLKKVDETIVKEYRPIIHSDKCVYCGLCADYCEYNAIFYVPELKQIKLLPNLCHGCKACSVACQYGVIEDSNTEIGIVSSYIDKDRNLYFEGKLKEGSVSTIPMIKSTISQASKQLSDFILIDSPPGTSCPFIQTSIRSDFVILVTEPTPYGLSDLRQAILTLDSMNKSYGVIINRAWLGNMELYDYLLENNIQILGEIPFSKEIARMYTQGDLVYETMEDMNLLYRELCKKIINYGNSLS